MAALRHQRLLGGNLPRVLNSSRDGEDVSPQTSQTQRKSSGAVSQENMHPMLRVRYVTCPLERHEPHQVANSIPWKALRHSECCTAALWDALGMLWEAL